MTSAELKARIAARRARESGNPDEQQIALANEQSFFNGVVEELKRVRAGVPFEPSGQFGWLVDEFATQAYKAMTDFYRHPEGETESETPPQP